MKKKRHSIHILRGIDAGKNKRRDGKNEDWIKYEQKLAMECALRSQSRAYIYYDVWRQWTFVYEAKTNSNVYGTAILLSE